MSKNFFSNERSLKTLRKGFFRRNDVLSADWFMYPCLNLLTPIRKGVTLFFLNYPFFLCGEIKLGHRASPLI